MSLLIAIQNRNIQPLIRTIQTIDKNIEIELWPEIKQPSSVVFALAWNHPQYLFSRFPNLKAISSLGAGVDHLLSDPSLPEHVRISRIVSPSLVVQMSDYILMSVLNLIRNTSTYHTQKTGGVWNPLPALRKDETTVGILGLGELGRAAANHLKDNGFLVNGYSQSLKQINGINTYSANDLDPFLHSTNILVNLLPLTSDTEGILNLNLFKLLKKPSFLINTARGEHLVDEDLLYALDTGLISHAIMDVFKDEPLPESHPFWARRDITITPHVASITDPEEAAKIVTENYKRSLSGMDLLFEVDRTKGY